MAAQGLAGLFVSKMGPGDAGSMILACGEAAVDAEGRSVALRGARWAVVLPWTVDADLGTRAVWKP